MFLDRSIGDSQNTSAMVVTKNHLLFLEIGDALGGGPRNPFAS